MKVFNIFLILVTISGSFLSCSKKKKKKQVDPPRLSNPVKSAKRVDTLVSTDILERKMNRGPYYMRFIMVSFNVVSPRFVFKSKSKLKPLLEYQARAKVKKIINEIKRGISFKKLMNKYSDDPNTAEKGYLTKVELDGTPTMVKKLVPRLKMGEFGVLRESNLYRIVKRVPAPPKVKNIDSVEILKRTEISKKASFKVINIGWRLLNNIYQGYLSKKARERTKARAAQIAQSVLAQLKTGIKFDDLYKKYSERLPQDKSDDHRHGFTKLETASIKAHEKETHGKHPHQGHSKGTPEEQKARLKDKYEKAMELSKIKELAGKLKVGEAGIVETKFGYHIVKRFK